MSTAAGRSSLCAEAGLRHGGGQADRTESFCEDRHPDGRRQRSRCAHHGTDLYHPGAEAQGYGKRLLDDSLQQAKDMGSGAVLFEGNIHFYGHCGFDYARKFGICYHNLPESADDSFFLCKELIPGYLNGVLGVYLTPEAYYVSQEETDRFDKRFPRRKS